MKVKVRKCQILTLSSVVILRSDLVNGGSAPGLGGGTEIDIRDIKSLT